MENHLVKVRRALISVSDKNGIVEFARALLTQGVDILSTGGTAQLLKLNGIVVTEVADYTGFPEMMEGRVKTLHPKVHGGILARRDKPGHVKAMEEHGIPPIDMVVVNLYPFARTVARYGVRPIVQAPLRAFFVEDNDDLREQITWMLEEEGVQVRAFADAEEALAAYEPDEVDVVITDVSLIGMSGVDLARAILRRAPQAWVVFSSGYAMGNVLNEFGPHARALLKPFDFEDVRRLIEEISAQCPSK